MGLRSVFKAVHQYGHDVHVSSLKQSRIAIDIMTYIIRFYKVSRKRNSNQTDEWINLLFSFLRSLKEQKISIICVFDGTNKPAEKLRVINERRDKLQHFKDIRRDIMKSPDMNEETRCKKIKEIEYYCSFPSREEIDDTKVLISHSLQIPVIIADGDGELFCCEMQKRGEVDYVLSEDSDVLFYGSTDFLCYKGGGVFRKYNTARILSNYGITSEKFFYLCLLIGSDYNTCINGIKFEEAKELVRHNTVDQLKHIITNAGVNIPRMLEIINNTSGRYFQYDIEDVARVENKYIHH